MLWLHLQRHMLVNDLCRQVAQTRQVINVLGIHQHTARQGAGLGTGLLVHAVEQGLHAFVF